MRDFSMFVSGSWSLNRTEDRESLCVGLLSTVVSNLHPAPISPQKHLSTNSTRWFVEIVILMIIYFVEDE
jgi:hypothetical protein